MYTWIVLLLVVSSYFFYDDAFAQETITVNNTTPCFLNYTASLDMWDNCGADEDYIDFALLPWEWITGGNFSLMLVSLLILITYIKYHKVVYPIMIGIMFLPVSYFVFPDTFLVWSILMVGVTMGILIWYIYVRQTKEY